MLCLHVSCIFFQIFCGRGHRSPNILHLAFRTAIVSEAMIDLFCSSPVDFSIFRSLELPNPLLREASQKDYRLKPRSCCVRYEQNADVMLCSE